MRLTRDECTRTDEIFMREAVRRAQSAFDQDEVPVGAVIAHRGEIIARAHNQVELLKDPTAHAEMIAITQATHALGVKWLKECCCYVTIEPCHMCAGALVLSRISRIVFGAFDLKAGACGSVAHVAQNPRLNHRVDVAHGVLGEECGRLLSDFFALKRREGRT